MTPSADENSRKELLKSAYRKIEELRTRLAERDRRESEPIAIVGMGCRFPGGCSDPDSFWRLLSTGGDGIGEMPGDRWDVNAHYDPDPEAPHKMYVRRGGYIEGVRAFDPPFFHVSPQEASSMEPQQRVLLEVSWEALENAGLPPDRLSGTSTGVFVGMASGDYSLLAGASPESLTDSSYGATGGSPSVAAGRLSYFYGFRGPSMAVDTACAAALTSVHLAVQSLRSGECKMALAGSVNIILTPYVIISLCKARMLSPEGKCKTFDAGADGYARSEGCGMLVLKLLSQAQADGDRIMAVIRGSACNQDGRTNGITAPNGNAQREVIRAALAASGLSPSDVDFIETHGTGTSLGDPIELQALSEVFAPGRPAGQQLILGAVKSNIGHLETAAGIASLAKAILVLQKGQIPPNLHFHTPNPLIPWDTLPFTVPTALTPWPEGRRRVAGVSGFGFSGTNVHLVLEQAPAVALPEGEIEKPIHLLTLSAQSPTALEEMTRRYVAWLEANPDAPVGDVCFTANAGRAHLAYRMAVTGATLADLKAGLERSEPARARSAPVQPPRPGLFILQEPISDLHRDLHRASPVFRAAIDACDRAASELFGAPLPAAVWSGAVSLSVREETILAFALCHAMAEQWRAWSVEPAAASGAGIGLCAAAVFAGAISVTDGLRLAVDSHAGERGGIEWNAPRIALISPSTGEAMTAESLTQPTVWTSAASVSPVDVRLAAFKREGAQVVIALGAAHDVTPGLIAASGAGWNSLLQAVGQLFVAGLSVDWEKFEKPWRRRRVALPTYPFQRQECPLMVDTMSAAKSSVRKEEHPFLGWRVHSSQFQDQVVFESEFDTSRLPLVREHAFFGMPVVPAAMMLEMAAAAGRILMHRNGVEVSDIVIEQPLLLPDGHARLVQTAVTPEGDGKFSFIIMSAAVEELDATPAWQRHCSGRLGGLPVTKPGEESVALDRLRAASKESKDPEWFYGESVRLGLEYGPSFRLIRSVHAGGGGFLVQLQLPAEIARRSEGIGIHPGMLDGVLQSVGFLGAVMREGYQDPYMPVAIDSYWLSVLKPDELWCQADFSAGPEEQPDLAFGNVRIYSKSGELVGELKGLQLKRNSKRDFAKKMAQRQLANWLFDATWEPLPALPKAADGAGTWLIVSDGGTASGGLTGELQSRNGRCVCASPGDAEHCDALFRRISESGEALRGVVFFVSNGSTEDVAAPRIASAGVEQLLHLTQALARNLPGELGTFAVVTEGFKAPGIGRIASMTSGAAWGLARTIGAELPGLHCKLIDLDPACAEGKATAALADELCSGSDETQVALGEGERMALRLGHAGSSIIADDRSGSAGTSPVQLDFAARGDFRELHFAPQSIAPPGPNEAQLRVLATAMNFRDVLNVLGMYPGDPGPVGVECVGEIVALGVDVTGWSVGQRVLAMPRRGYSTFTNTDVAFMFPCPPHLSVPEAATLLVAYVTAAYSLCHLGGMKAGDRVLIHAATGGVGLAALQLAQRAGAEIFATAGSPAKREYLRALGVRHIMDSRSLDFAAQIREATGGEGVDLVLNSLTGSAIREGLLLLRPGGHFLEIGKNELLTPERVAAINPEAHYHVIDLYGPFTQTPAVIQGLVADLTESLASGALKPLPYRTFHLPDAPQAFRYMAAARHIGKVVVIDPTAAAATPYTPDGTYLITGGLGGLGLLVARRMVEEGARRIVLTGRSAPKLDALPVIAELEAAGARIIVAQADIGDRAQVAALLAAHTSPANPLRGIVHAAGVLDDGVLLAQDWSRFVPVLRPKIDGAWNLHELTLGMPLEFFVLFASTAGLLGSPGQSNYAAGNAFLDSLAQARQAAGLPALSIDWGAWGQVGMAAALDERITRGWDVIDPARGVDILQALIGRNHIAQMAVLPVDASAWRPAPGQAVPPLFRKLAHASGVKATASASTGPSPAERLRAAPAGEKRSVLIELVGEIVLDTFGLDRSRGIPPDQNLTMLGMDSLLAIQLSNRLKTSFGAAVPSTLTFQYPTIEDIAGYLLSVLPAIDGAPEPTADAAPANPTSVEAGEPLDAEKARMLLANLDQISDEDVEALLAVIETESGAK